MVRPLAPCSETGQIVYDELLDAFGAKPQTQSESPQQDSVSLLPPEVLEAIFRHLDGFSLNQVSRTCKFFREICFGLLEEKGLVLPVWKKISKGMYSLF